MVGVYKFLSKMMTVIFSINNKISNMILQKSMESMR